MFRTNHLVVIWTIIHVNDESALKSEKCAVADDVDLEPGSDYGQLISFPTGVILILQ